MPFFHGKKIMNFDIFLTLYHSKVNIINCLKSFLTICFLILCEVSSTWLLEVQKKLYCLNLYLFEQIKVFICEDQIWLDVLKICYTTSKLQWSNPKHTFCLWKLGEDIHQSIIEFLVFLVKKKILTAGLWQSLPSRSWEHLPCSVSQEHHKSLLAMLRMK